MKQGPVVRALIVAYFFDGRPNRTPRAGAAALPAPVRCMNPATSACTLVAAGSFGPDRVTHTSNTAADRPI